MNFFIKNRESFHFQKPITNSSFQEVENLFNIYDISSVEYSLNLNYESENLIWKILKGKKKVKNITIYDLSLTYEDFDQFLKTLDENSSITELILNIDITNEQMKVFSTFLAQSTSIKTLKFVLKSKNSNTLIDGLILNKSITNLSLGNPTLPLTQELLVKILENNQTLCHLTVQYLKGELEELGKVLINNTTLESFKLFNIKECSSLSGFCSSINQNKSLKSLLINNKNDPNDDKSFCELLKYNSNLKELYLLNDTIRNGRIVSEALKSNKNLVKLDLSLKKFNNEVFGSYFRVLNETSIHTLIMRGVNSQLFHGNHFDPLKDNTKLTVLILDNNNLGKKGLKNLIENLKHHKYLKELEIESIGTNYGDHYCLKDLISGCETLERLSIGDNIISTKEIISLVKTLKETDRLKELELSYLNMGNEPCEALGEYFSQTKRLEHINLSSNEISRSEEFNSLVKGIEINQSIKSINLENNDFSSDEFVDIMNALFYNLTLTQLDMNMKYDPNIKDLLFFKDMCLIRNSKIVSTFFRLKYMYDVQFKFI